LRNSDLIDALLLVGAIYWLAVLRGELEPVALSLSWWLGAIAVALLIRAFTVWCFKLRASGR
jgi:hypothetical protein